MNHNTMKTLLLLAVIFSAACAALDSRPPEQIVADRAQAYLSALVSKQYDKAYAYTSPGYRSGVSAQEFTRRWLVRPVQWEGAAVKKVTCDETICTAAIDVKYEVRIPSAYVGDYRAHRLIELKWFQSEDKLWYYSPTR